MPSRDHGTIDIGVMFLPFLFPHIEGDHPNLLRSLGEKPTRSVRKNNHRKLLLSPKWFRRCNPC